MKVLPELDEIHMGAWDGLSFESIRQDFPDAYAERGRRFADFRPPNGENFSDVADRAMTALGALSTESQPTLILTHAGVIRSVLCRLTGRSMDDLFFFRPGHIQSTIVEATGDGLKFIATDILPEAIVSYL